MFSVLLCGRGMRCIILPVALFHLRRAALAISRRGSTFDEVDRQIEVSAEDSSLSSCKQSASPGAIPEES